MFTNQETLVVFIIFFATFRSNAAKFYV